MSVTRKLPHSLGKHGLPTARGEHLIPSLLDQGQAGFVGVRSGRTFPLGYIGYVGRDVTPEMLLEVFQERHSVAVDRRIALDWLEAFVVAIQDCKIGNLLSVTYTPDGFPLIKIEKDVLLHGPKKQLP